MSIESKAIEIVDDFSLFSDWNDKYEHIFELGKSLPPFKDALKTEDRLIKGCQSKVWLNAEFDGEKMNYSADSDALITKGIVALIINVVNEERPSDVVKYEFGFIDKIGLRDHLSMTRSNGLVSMVNQIKQQALQYI